ncbi:MAG: sulfatase-like hydrolase/transferase [Patescibacteria group bacterium]
MFKNIVIVSIDSLRADGINYNRDLIYGKNRHKNIKTPNLDKFAREGTSFINTYSTNTYTTSAHASLFTGEYPPIHGVRAFFDLKQKLSSKTKTLAEELGEKGFKTFFYSDIKVLFSEMDIWRGFQIKTHGNMNVLWDSLRELKKEKNFVFIHTFDIHIPYLFSEDKSGFINNKKYFKSIKELRKKFKVNSLIDPTKHPHESWDELMSKIENSGINEKKILGPMYEKGIEFFDKIKFNYILNNLKLVGINETNSLIVILSDHGEGRNNYFKKPDVFYHGGTLTEEVGRVILMLNIKKFPNNNKYYSLKNVKNLLLSILMENKKIKRDKILYFETIGSTNAFPREIKKTMSNKVSHWLSSRGIIYKGKKYILFGFPDFFLDMKLKKQLFKEKPNNFIENLYFYILDRKPTSAEIKYWVNNLNKNFDREQILDSIINSDENKKNFNFLIASKIDSSYSEITENKVNLFINTKKFNIYLKKLKKLSVTALYYLNE